MTSRAHAEQLFGALAARVSDPLRDPKYDSARVKIANAAFLPSRVWDDSTVWTVSTASRRSLFINGRLAQGHYRLEAAQTPMTIAQLADSRHVINLTNLSDDTYAWDTDVSYALGSVRATEIAASIGAFLTSAEGRSDREVRADYRAAIPLTSAILGQLFAVDSIRTTQLPDHSTLATYAISLTPAGVEARYPNFARYVRRYAETARMHWTITDHSGATYLELAAGGGMLTLRVRSLGRSLVPLTGLVRPVPDTLALNGDFTMKVRRFTVGFHDYQSELTIIRTDHERAWNILTRREPKWVLPLVTERLLRTPLRRPFQGSGALFRIGVRDDTTGAQTILHRRMHLEVQESTILRFIGKLGAIAVGDFSGKVEREQNAWLREVLGAILADLRNLDISR